MSAGLGARVAQVSSLLEQGKLDQARAMVQRYIAADPRSVEWPDLMRTILTRLGHHQQAVHFAERAVAMAPLHAGVRGELALLQNHLGKHEEAIANLKRAIELEPTFAPVRSALLAILISQNRLGEAEPIARAGLDIDPDNSDLSMKLGAIELETLRVHEAFNRLASLRLNRDAGKEADARLIEYQATLANYAGLDDEASGQPLTPSRIAALHREAGQQVESHSPARAIKQPARLRQSVLRVAIISPDFRRHPVAFFIEPFLKHADRSRIELVGMTTGRSDEFTERLKPSFAAWHDLSQASPRQISDAIRAARPDVLLELAGLTVSHTLEALTDRPAPVQATYLGYPNSTGCRFIDYRIVDSITDPAPQCDALCTEKLVRIDPCFLCYGVPADAPPSLPRHSSGPITFCCFNRLQKISPQTLTMWAEILRLLPDARIALKDGHLRDTSTLEVIKRELARWGVDASRVDLLPMTPTLHEHWESFNRCHIALDAYPYHGTTTTCEALLMGTPVVTLAGPTHVARVGASILTSAGVPELVASSPQAYVQLAVSLATDRARLADYHGTLASRFRTGPICDQPAFAQRMARALEGMADGMA